jgi:peptidoglycan-associated lipoprotein
MFLFVVASLLGCPKQVTPVAEVPRVEMPAAEIPKPPAAAVVDEVKRNFSRVNFEFDSDRVTNPEVLGTNAKLLQENPGIRVEIQGHCDERGTSEYNVALGERRAAAIVRTLSSQGVPKNRLETVSFGEERPLATGDGESVWAENRRAEFRVLTGGGVDGTIR